LIVAVSLLTRLEPEEKTRYVIQLSRNRLPARRTRRG
jgi:hypothetical protein